MLQGSAHTGPALSVLRQRTGAQESNLAVTAPPRCGSPLRSVAEERCI
jgi:hypothetical protein